MYFLLKIGIFHCYVSLPEGSCHLFFLMWKPGDETMLDGSFSHLPHRAKQKIQCFPSLCTSSGLHCCKILYMSAFKDFESLSFSYLSIVYMFYIYMYFCWVVESLHLHLPQCRTPLVQTKKPSIHDSNRFQNVIVIFCSAIKNGEEHRKVRPYQL